MLTRGNLLATEEPFSHTYNQPGQQWKILVVDNEEEIHIVTRMVLEDFTFEDKPFTILSAYGEADTKQILRDNSDIALVLLDVVMDTDRSGLDLVKFIRTELKNGFVRIILRTGQPGSAPESRVIIDYDIDDYKEKTELTAQKLRTTVITALRAYRDLRTIDRNQEQLRTYHTFLQQILQSIASPLLVVDESFIPVLWNQAAAEELGLDEETGKAVWEYAEYLKNSPSDFRTALSGGSIVRKRNLQSPGTSEYRNLILYPLSSPVGNGLVVRIDDVSEIRRMDDQLRRAQKLDAVGNLSAGIAHDLNNILGGIIGAVSLIELEKEDVPEKHNSEYDLYLSTIRDATDRAANMVRQLLSITRKSEQEKEILDLVQAMRNVISICESSFDKTIEIKTSYPSGQALVCADAGGMEQVLLNLCINAAHAMTIMRPPDQHRGGVLSVSVVRSDQPAQWRIRIADDGVGIPREIRDSIFDPFFTTKPQGSGTGLGLAMVHNIVTQAGGQIDVESEPGRGTAFILSFPEAGERAPQPAGKQEGELHLGRGTVLLCDDEELMRRVGSRILEKCGYEVILASDGEESVAKYSDRMSEIDCVILDIQMPKLSGLEVYAKLKEANPEVKVLLSSGFKDDDRIDRFMDAGIQVFLQKPYTMEKLSAAVKGVIG